MEGCDGSDIGFRHGGGDFLNFPHSGMTPNSVPEEVSGTAIHPFVSSGWDPLVSLTQGYHYANPSLASGPFSAQLAIMENQETAGDFPPPLGHNLSALTESVSFSRLPCSESRSYPNAVGYFGWPDIASSGCAPNYGSHREDDHDGSEGASANNGLSQGRRLKEDAEGSSPSVKRRKIASGRDPIYDRKEDVKKDPSRVNSDVPKEWDEKKQKNEEILYPSSQGKQNGKQVKDNVEAPKENYIHVRARRGQATNSHSLAERVRREKISERMRMLQELVPGCNKITGKAVMLDEIINYVQSLQHQVEFLSMKLAAVSPELSINLERILSKDIFCSQGSSATIVGSERGMASTCPYTQGFFSEAFPSIPSLNHHYPPLTQAFCESELQTHCQLGFHSSSGVDSLDLDGRLKSEK